MDMEKLRKTALHEVVSDTETFDRNFNNEENSYIFACILKHLAKC